MFTFIFGQNFKIDNFSKIVIAISIDWTINWKYNYFTLLTLVNDKIFTYLVGCIIFVNTDKRNRFFKQFSVFSLCRE